ncbi:hypothetical protein LSAT2_003657 [Lamellibrachia satsuma]|nr:hypothetical protein LSAT2_003657 [Lamellibrachia satsuma]
MSICDTTLVGRREKMLLLRLFRPARMRSLLLAMICATLIDSEAAADVHPLLVATDTAIFKVPVVKSATPPVHGPPSQLISGGNLYRLTSSCSVPFWAIVADQLATIVDY